MQQGLLPRTFCVVLYHERASGSCASQVDSLRPVLHPSPRQLLNLANVQRIVLASHQHITIRRLLYNL